MTNFLRKLRTATPTRFSLIVGSLISLLFFMLFLAVTEDVVMQEPLVTLDALLAQAVYGLRTPLLSKLMLLITDIGGARVVVAGVLLASLWMGLHGRYIYIVGLIASVVVGEGLVWELKGMLQRSRPGLDHALVAAPGASFPSGHSFVAFAFYGYLAWFAFRHEKQGWVRVTLGSLFLALAFLIGLSRIYLGVHWPSDVLAAYLLGAAWVSLVLTGIVLAEKSALGNRLTGPRHARIGVMGVALFTLWLAVVATSYLSDMARIHL